MGDALGDVLLADEARHNLPLGLLATARAQPEVYPDVVGWVVRDAERRRGRRAADAPAQPDPRSGRHATA